MKLALFFTRGVSVELWKKVGMLDREIKPYKKLLSYFDEIYFLTYKKNEPKIEGIKILPVSAWRSELKDVDIFKTNQISGSWNAVLAKKIFKKKLVVRQGKQWSISDRRKKLPFWRIIGIDLAERFAYKNADAIIVSSKEDQKYIIDRYRLETKKVHYLPNYIDTDLFKPESVRTPGSNISNILTVAKLYKQKNLENLIEAVKKLDVKLTIIGNGPLQNKLKRIAAANVKFINMIPNEELSKEINKSKLFILPSHFEGCPKALLEAMSCAVPVIGSNVTGIKEIINDRVNGYLCETSKESIRNAIIDLLGKENLQKKISLGARKTILEDFSLEKLIKKEIKIYDEILQS